MNMMGLDSRGRMRLKLTLPLPPTDNQIYFNHPRGGRRLSDKARSYKNVVKAAVVPLAATSTHDFQTNVPYEMIIKVFLEATENKGYWEGKTVNRYKKVDSTNRVKLVADAIAEAIGIDDCHIFRTTVVKNEDPDEPRLVVTWREQEPRK